MQNNIAEELYAKNVELVNANTALELLQDLYGIIIGNQDLVSISQLFIEKIILDLGFTDGLVLIKDDSLPRLNLVGLTQTEVNKTILEIFSLPKSSVHFDLNLTDNAFVKCFGSNLPSVTNGIVGAWTPYVKQGDLDAVKALNRKSFLFPINFGQKQFGVFSVSIDPKLDDLTAFEIDVLSRVKTVFGIAIDRAKTEEELKMAQISELNQAREVIRLKDEFVFIATHDLRTPVTAISGFTELIEQEKGNLPESIKEDFEAIKEASNRLGELTDDLLEVARSESGTIKVEPKPVDITEIVNHVVNEVRPSADKRGIKFEINLSEDTKVMADDEKLQEVIENLMSNAVKYNKDNGSVRLTTQTDANRLVFIVEDTGIGVPENKKDKMFTKFFRAHQEGTEDIPGTGLGLFVVRMLVEKMGGQIGFESTEGVGSKFTFSLPRVG